MTSMRHVGTKNRDAAISRFRRIGEVTAARLSAEGLYLKQTCRMLSTELIYLRMQQKGPRFIVGKGVNGHVGYYYRFDDLLAWFGGPDAIFHRDDTDLERGERPSAQHFKRRATI